MKYCETIRIHSRHNLNLQEFLKRHDLVEKQADGERLLDWLAGEFLPETEVDETFAKWIARQVTQILNTTLLHDTMTGSTHIARKVASVELDNADCEWLIKSLGQHRDVRRMWESILELPAAFGVAA